MFRHKVVDLSLKWRICCQSLSPTNIRQVVRHNHILPKYGRLLPRSCSNLCQNYLFCTLYRTYSNSVNTPTLEPSRKDGVLSLDEIYNFIVRENGRDITVINLAKEANYVDYFIIVTANSGRHLIHMADMLNRYYKSKKTDDDPFRIIEGKRTSKDWQCIDLGNAVIHFMMEDVREKYQMEKLWLLGPKYDDLTRVIPTVDDMIKQATEQGLKLMSTVGENHVDFLDDSEIVNPWDIPYKDDNKDLEFEDEDEYIV